MLWLVLGNLRKRWIEYALVTLAVALVVGALVTHRSLTASAESTVHELAHRLGKNMLVVPAEMEMTAFWHGEYGPLSLDEDAGRRVLSSSVAQHVKTTEARLYANVSVNGVPLVLVGQDVGLPPGGHDVPPAVLGPGAARKLAAGPGHIVPIARAPVSIAGVLESAPDGLDDAVFVPLSDAQRILRRPGAITALRLGGCWCRIDVAALGREIERILPGTKAVTVAGVLNAQKGSVAETARYAAWLLAAGAFLVAALVAALVVSQTRRRSRDVALLSAIGAHPGWTAAMLTLEAALAGGVGGALGYLAAAPATSWLSRMAFGAPLVPGWDLFLPAVAATFAVSAIAAAIPAARAARRDPVAVLQEA